LTVDKGPLDARAPAREGDLPATHLHFFAPLTLPSSPLPSISITASPKVTTPRTSQPTKFDQYWSPF